MQGRATPRGACATLAQGHLALPASLLHPTCSTAWGCRTAHFPAAAGGRQDRDPQLILVEKDKSAAARAGHLARSTGSSVALWQLCAQGTPLRFRFSTVPFTPREANITAENLWTVVNNALDAKVIKNETTVKREKEPGEVTKHPWELMSCQAHQYVHSLRS